MGDASRSGRGADSIAPPVDFNGRDAAPFGDLISDEGSDEVAELRRICAREAGRGDGWKDLQMDLVGPAEAPVVLAEGVRRSVDGDGESGDRLLDGQAGCAVVEGRYAAVARARP